MTIGSSSGPPNFYLHIPRIFQAERAWAMQTLIFLGRVDKFELVSGGGEMDHTEEAG